VALRLDPSAPEITTDAERLRVALINLIVNARQAVIGREGTLGEAAGAGAGGTFASRADPAPVAVVTSAAETQLTISIIDNGKGIAPEDLSRVFDPYFTTKRGGTGLGLPIAKNIVEGLGGTLTVVSRAGNGTELRIELPVGETAARHHPTEQSVA
jgi:signal transduction histidine kinase